jgi:GTPase SAR1 family protein
MTSLGIGLLVAAAVATVIAIIGVQYGLTRTHRRETEERLLQAERAAAEKQKRLDELLLASERNARSIQTGASITEPRALPPVPEDLIAALRTGDCTLFAGSGVSAQSGFPVWQQALQTLIAYFDSRGGPLAWDPVRIKLSNGELDQVADLISSRVQRSELLELLADIYGRPAAQSKSDLSNHLAVIPFARVLTANWDSVVEETFKDRDPVVLSPDRSDRFAEVYRSSSFLVLKLSGLLSEPKSVSFSAEEFRRAVDDNPNFFKFVSSVFSTSTILFLGVSLAGIEQFVTALRLRSNPDRAHFALVPWQPDTEVQQERFQSKYGIRLLPFRASPGFPEVAKWANALGQRVSNAELANLRVPIRHRAITRVRLENIGSFESLDVNLNSNWNVLLGNNGVGKSTLLRAIALGFCGADGRAATAARTLLRAGAQRGIISIWLGDDRFESRLLREGASVRVEFDGFTPFQSGTLVALGFPPLRGVSLRNPQGLKELEASDPVVDDVLPLLLGLVDTRVDNLKQWLVNIQGRIDSVATPPDSALRARQMRDTFFRVIDALSPGLDVSLAHVDTRTWQVMVLTADGVVPIDQLSQGMTSMLGWVGALLERLYEIHTTSDRPEEEPGVLLVDEIAAHMHPEWEYAMVPLLRGTFPSLQVIATTHSPLVVANMKSGEVFHLHRIDGRVQVEQLSVAFEGLRTDQVLTGPAFGLSTTLDPDTARMRDEYTVLLGATRDAQKEQRFQELARLLAMRIPKPHEREEGREAIALLEQWMAERIKAKPIAQRQRILKEAEMYLAQLDTGSDGPATGGAR